MMLISYGVLWAKTIRLAEETSLAAWRCSLAAGGPLLALVRIGVLWRTDSGVVFFGDLKGFVQIGSTRNLIDRWWYCQ